MNLQDLPVLPPQSLQQSIRSTLCFFDLFDYPLTFEELKFYLLSVQQFSDEEIVSSLEHDASVVLKDGFYCLKGSEGHVNSRKVRSVIAANYFKKLRRFLPFIRLVPFVKMVAVCNTLAIGCPTAKSDIDLFVVSKKNRIFLVRTLTTVLFHLLGVRRHNEKIAGRFCLSFFVSDEKLDLSDLLKNKNDVYFMYWFRTLQPLYGRETFQKFVEANVWAKEYFPDLKDVDSGNMKPFWKSGRIYRLIALFWEFVLGGFLGDFLEGIFSKKHLKRHALNMKSLTGGSSVIVNKYMLKYHNVDRREEYRQMFFEKLLKLQ